MTSNWLSRKLWVTIATVIPLIVAGFIADDNAAKAISEGIAGFITAIYVLAQAIQNGMSANKTTTPEK